MATISPLVKNALSYRTLSLMIILTSAMGIFIFIYSAYIQWGNNKASLINEDIITPLNNFNEKYKWNLSSSANNRIDAPPLVSGNVDTLSNIHLSGIIHSSDKLSSRAILQEGGEQNVYSIDDVLKSSNSTRIIDITKNQVFFSSGGNTAQLTLFTELTPPAATPEKVNEQPAPTDVTLSDFIEAIPVVDKNVLRGLRLLPRGNTELFSRTAIAPGDIAIQLNNMSLTQQANITHAQEALRHLQTAQITLLRNTSPKLINVAVQQFQDGQDK